MKRRHSFMLLAAAVCLPLALINLTGSLSNARAQDAPGGKDRAPYVLGDHVWESKQDFLMHGRCVTPTRALLCSSRWNRR